MKKFAALRPNTYRHLTDSNKRKSLAEKSLSLTETLNLKTINIL